MNEDLRTEDMASPSPNESQKGPHLHIGRRKLKSIFAMFLGFCFWQLLRLLVPGLEPHPLFIYIYAMMEIRESSEKTRVSGKKRILATLIAIGVGLPFLLLTDLLRSMPQVVWKSGWYEIVILLTGTLAVLCAAEWANCRDYCGLAASIAVILMISHFESSVYLHSLMRAVQTIVGVSIAWLVNVKLFPYPATKGSLSAWLLQRRERRSLLRAEAENAEQDAASVSDTDREDVDECGYKDCKS